MSRSYPGFACHSSAIDGDRYSNDYDRSELRSQTLSKSVIISRQACRVTAVIFRESMPPAVWTSARGKKFASGWRPSVFSSLPHISFHCEQFLFLIIRAFRKAFLNFFTSAPALSRFHQFHRFHVPHPHHGDTKTWLDRLPVDRWEDWVGSYVSYSNSRS